MTEIVKDIAVVRNNWPFVVGVATIVFTVGSILAEFRVVKTTIEEEKINTKYRIEEIERWQEEQEERIDYLEEQSEWEKGYEQGLKDAKK